MLYVLYTTYILLILYNSIILSYDNNSIITQNTCKLYIHYIIVLLKLDRYILCSQRWRSSIPSVETRPGADCGPDHEILLAKFRLKWKKVEKTTRPVRYDLNKIPYDLRSVSEKQI